MKGLHYFSIALLLLLFTSCKKQNETPQYQFVTESGSYRVSSGKMTVILPDTTLVFNASNDLLGIDLMPWSILNSFSLYSSNVKANSYMLIQLSVVPKSGTNYTSAYFGCNYKKGSALIQYVGNGPGTLNISKYNSADGTLISGTLSGAAANMADGSTKNIVANFSYDLNVK